LFPPLDESTLQLHGETVEQKNRGMLIAMATATTMTTVRRAS